jgi:transposase
VELFENIRRDQVREDASIRGLATRYGVHRRTVRQALDRAMPPTRKPHSAHPAPKLGPHKSRIDGWLEEDRRLPRKQRHTAHRIWRRLVDEYGSDIGERAVRYYVRERKREIGLGVCGFVPQAHQPGQEAEVDWGEASVVLAGEETRVHVFMMRACWSGATFARAYLQETQQAFLDGHTHAFAFFGGVFRLVRYDNLRSAVKKVLKGRKRIETERFIALRSHYVFDSSFTSSGTQGAHEKGGIEGEVGRFRRNNLVPVPHVATLGELNTMLEAACERDLARTISGADASIGERFEHERSLMSALPTEAFDPREASRVRVNQKSLITVRQNHYSVPASLIGLMVEVRIGASQIEVFHNGQAVAGHERRTGRYETEAKLEHYLDLLRDRPGALKGALALRQERERGGWPDCFDRIWKAIEVRYGRSAAASQMVDVLLLARDLGKDRVELAVRGALTAGAHDGRAVAVLARRSARTPSPVLGDLDGRLTIPGARPPDLGQYDALLSGGGR